MILLHDFSENHGKYHEQDGEFWLKKGSSEMIPGNIKSNYSKNEFKSNKSEEDQIKDKN